MTNRRIVIPVVIGLILLALLLILLFTRGQTPPAAEAATATAQEPSTHTTAPSAAPSLTSSALPPTATETPLVPTPSDNQGLLTAPVGLTGEPGNTVVRLMWQPVAGAAGYVVFRDEAKTPLNALVLAETSYLDIGLSNKRAYRYAVAAVDAQGQVGALSPLITVTPGQ